jgi:hypothetical protein
MGVRTVNTTDGTTHARAQTAQATGCSAPANRDAAQAFAQAGPARGNFAPPRSAATFPAIALAAIVSLSAGLLFSSARAAQAGLSDLFSSSSNQSQTSNRTITKAGIGQNKKHTTATRRMLDSVTSAPRKMMGSTMSALLPGKKPTTSKSRTIPRKLVSDQKPSMLKRLFTEPQPQQPQTVTEWMSQPRPK